MHLILVHGMSRTAWSLGRLARRLRDDGHSVERIGYVSAVERFDAIRDRVRRRLVAASESGVAYAVIGHSLGGILLRAAAALDPPLRSGPAQMILLGSPNQAPRMATRFARSWPYRLLNGECGQMLVRSELYAGLPPPNVPTTVIAGTGGSRGPGTTFGDEANDGTIAVSEARLAGAALIEVPARHGFMMNHPEVVGTIRRLLATERTS